MQAVKYLIILSFFIVNSAYAADPVAKTVEAINLESKQLNGKQVRISGKVVKVNNGIMKRNFLHIQDGSGKKGSDDVTVTSKQTAKVGDSVVITGTVVVNKDFGFGYNYPVLVENSNIQVK